jgi:hypothetical protein
MRQLVTAMVACAALGAVIASAPSSAVAAFQGRLPGHTTTASGAEYYMSSMLASVEGGETCIGPASWNGSSYVWPYGYKCGSVTVAFNFPWITDHLGVYNPGANTIHFSVEPG